MSNPKKSAYAQAMEDAGYGSGAAERPWGACHVTGCLLPGVMTASTTGTDAWFCSVHFGAPRSLWADLTARVANRAALLDIGRRLAKLEPNAGIPAEAIKGITAAGRTDLLDPKIGTARKLGRAILGALEHEIKHHDLQPQMAGLAQQAAVSGFVTADDEEVIA